MADVNINKFRASVVRDGSKPASPGFIVSEGQDPVDPAGNGQNHLPVTIATAATGLSITDSQVLGGAGTVGQYIRGDGSLADFPQASGGGSSVSYYLNGSISQGTIGGVAYKELNKVPILGAGTDFTINADGYIASFLTDAGDPNLLEIPGGNWNFETYFSASSSGGSPSFYVELYKYDGTTFTLIASSSSSPELIAFGTNLNPYFSTLAVPTTTLALTDRLAVRYYVTHSGRTITMHTENNTLCQIVTTFTTGLTSLNGLTAQVQNLAVGTSGTDFNIASATATHTFNLPTASATNRGALSSADWTTFNNKTSNLGTVTSVGLSSATSGVTIGSTPVTTSGTITLAIATASGSQNGLLSSTDWTTFNNKQNALTNPVTGTGASGQVAYFNGTSSITGESNLFWDATNDRLGIGLTPTIKLDILGSGGRTVRIDGPSNTDNFLSLFSGSIEMFIDADFTNSAGIVGTQSTHNLILRTAGTNRVWITTSGNLLVGTSTDNGARLQVSGTATTMATITSSATASGLQLTNSGGTASSWVIQSDGGAVAGQAALRFYSLTASAYRMSIDGSGNVGIGTSSPSRRLVVVGGNGNQLELDNTGQTFTQQFWKINGVETGTIWASTSEFHMYTYGSQDINFSTNTAPRMRITSSGNVLIGTTTDNGPKFRVNGSGGQIVRIEGPSNQDNFISVFSGTIEIFVDADSTNSAGIIGTQSSHNFKLRSAGTNRMNIDTSGNIGAPNSGSNIYNASDIRLKKNITNITNGLNQILALKPVKFNWIDGFVENEDGKDMLGFIAQEVIKAIPEAVESFSTKPISFKNTIVENPLRVNEKFIIPVLVKAIQELKQEIDTLKN